MSIIYPPNYHPPRPEPEPEVWDGESWDIVAWVKREEVVFMQEAGVHFGDWVLITYSDDAHQYAIYRGAWGSNDDFYDLWLRRGDKPITRELADDLFGAYLPFLVIPTEVMARFVLQGRFAELLPRNTRLWQSITPQDMTQAILEHAARKAKGSMQPEQDDEQDGN